MTELHGFSWDFSKASWLATLLDPWSRLSERDSYWPPSPTWKAKTEHRKAKSATWELEAANVWQLMVWNGFFLFFFGGGSSVWLWFVWLVLLRISSYRLTNRSLDHEVVFSRSKNIQKPGNWGLVKALLGWYVDGTWKNYVLLTMAIRGIDVEFQRYIFQTHILLSCLFQRDEHGNWHGSEV